LTIKKLAPGGPAARAGKLAVGDELVEVDGRNIKGQTLSDIQPYVSGPEGSSVNLGFRRRGTGMVRVTLRRIWTPSAKDLRENIGGQSNTTPVVCSRIVDGLYLSCSVAARNRGMLMQHNIGAVINCAQECVNHHQDTFQYLHFLLDDHNGENISAVFKEACEFIDEVHAQGKAVLLHCAQGRSRSATIVMAWLMRNKRMDLKTAARTVKSARPWVKPNEGFLAALCTYERKLLGSRTETPETLVAFFKAR